MRITMIGHSTVLIELGGRRVLTDPFFGPGNPAYRRIAPPAKCREDLADVDAVLVSHTHFDHVDRPYLRALPGTTPVLMPAGAAWQRIWIGARRVIGLGAWGTWQSGELRVTAVPARHLTTTVGYVLEAEERRVYFAGDTYRGPFMKEIGERFALDVALLPVTTFRLPMTMGETQAVGAVQDLSPRAVIPIHLGIEPKLPLLRTRQSPQGFERRLRAAKVDCRVVLLASGEAWEG